MTQHLTQQQTDEDRRTLRRLVAIVGGFFSFAVIMALIIHWVVG